MHFSGILILQTVQKILLAPQASRDNKVYEAIILSKDSFNFEGRGRDYIYISLSPL